MIIIILLWCILLTFGLFFVAWKARRANRALWGYFEQEKKRTIDRKRQETRQWQRAYGRLLAQHIGMDAPLKLTAQHGEDVYLVDYFAGAKDRVYVEVGAYDGVVFSNTYALEQIGWEGLLVEAHPENVAKCRDNRPKSMVAHAAIGGPDASGTVCFNMVEGPGGDVLSFVTADEKHLARCQREGSGIHQVEVPCRSLATLFEIHNITRVDFLSIDIEGAELDAIRGLPLANMRPRLILVEANDEEARSSLRDLMASIEYRELQEFEANLLFEDGKQAN